MHDRQQYTDEAAHHRAVESNELQVGTDAILDLGHQCVRIESFETLAHGDADLIVVASQQVVRHRTYPTIKRRTPFGIVEQVEDGPVQLAVNELGKIAARLVEIALELLAELCRQIAHQWRCLEAFECRVTELLDLRQRGSVAFGKTVGEALDRAEYVPTHRMLGVVGSILQLRDGVVAGGFDDLALHHLAPQNQRHQALAILCSCRAVRSSHCSAVAAVVGWRAKLVTDSAVLEGRNRAVATRQPLQPAAGRCIDGHRAQLALNGAIDELDDFGLGQESRQARSRSRTGSPKRPTCAGSRSQSTISSLGAKRPRRVPMTSGDSHSS